MTSCKRGPSGGLISRRRTLAYLAGGLLAPWVTARSFPAALESPRGRASLERALQDWLASIIERRWVSGAAVQVLSEAAPVTAMQGMADRESSRPIALDTVYRIYSMTKPVTTVAMMTLVERGLVKLDGPIADFLPEFAQPRVFVRFEGETVVTEPARTPITVRHLLTHTAGLSESFNDGLEPTAKLYKQAGLIAGQWYRSGKISTLADFSRAIAQIPLAAQPGTRWIYGTSLDVAGRVIEVASGMDFGEYVRRQVLEPLGMRDTAFQVSAAQRTRLAALYRIGSDGLERMADEQIPAWGTDHVIPTGGAGLFSTLPDYCRFARMLLNSGELDGVRVLRAASVDAMMTDQLAGKLGPEPLSTAARFGLGGEVKGLGFGLGGSVMLDPNRADGSDSLGEYAWGGAASTTFWVNRARSFGVVFMTQKLPSGVHPLRDELRERVYRLL
ncbi:serine hydrolase domain-containing protein [Peristeroidobacter soli]|uniref:serine hydrolase domain-containing protein n=1 Tax=Peristeroidobacter soli TaxID=2497877 RepID=UPI00101D8ABA|nr:serine hydrolase domain-containing protein [Peristeroidobacter soli]